MSKVSILLALSNQAVDEFKARRSQGDDYAGVMDDTTFKILSYMADMDVRQGMYKHPTVNAKTYNLFDFTLNGNATVKAAVDYITDKWSAHIIVIGAWDFLPSMRWSTDTNQYEPVVDGAGDPIAALAKLPDEFDEDGNFVSEGAVVYPLHAQAWRFMPDVVTYDENGVETSRIPSTSNADLRDINLLAGQAPRAFN